MNCSSASDLMMKYMDGTLQQDEVVELNKHLSFCEKCKEEFAIFDDILKQFDVMEEETSQLGQDFNDAVMSQIYDIGYIKRPSMLSRIAFTMGSSIIIFFALTILVLSYFQEIPFVAEQINNPYLVKAYEFFDKIQLSLQSFAISFSNFDFGFFGKIYIVLIFMVLCYGGLVSFKNFHKYYDRKKQQNEQYDYNN